MKRQFTPCPVCKMRTQHTLSEDKKHWICRQCGNKVLA